MVKLLVFVKKRPDISKEAFKTYYETKHVPLVKQLLPDCLYQYRRNYLETELNVNSDPEVAFEYDAVSEFVFKSDADYKKWFKAQEHEDNRAKLKQDESNFMLSNEMRPFLVSEIGA